MQLLLIAPIFIIIFYKKQIYGTFAIITAIILSLFASVSPKLLFGIRHYLQQLWGRDSAVFWNTNSFVYFYYTPNNYGISFFVGIAFGYMLKKKVVFTRSQEIYSWILSLVMIITVYFLHNSFWRLDKSEPLLNVFLWHSFGKLLFCSGFAWILYTCCIGRGGLYLFFAFMKKMSSKNSIQFFFSQIKNIFKQFFLLIFRERIFE
jgi:hypothetical protein